MVRKELIEEVKKALIKCAWNVNGNRENTKPLLVCYPNSVMNELFGSNISKDNWIFDNTKTEDG